MHILLRWPMQLHGKQNIATHRDLYTIMCALIVQCNAPPENNSDCRSHYLDHFYRPKVVVVYPCYHCWFTDSFKDPYTCTFSVALLLMMFGMMKMLCMFCCCRTSDGRYVDIAAMLLGTASEEHTRVYVCHHSGVCMHQNLYCHGK